MLAVEQGQQHEVYRPIPPVEHRWKPGQSGNPAGRPKRKLHVRDLIKTKADEFRDALLAVAKDEKAPAADRVAACKLAFEYLSGPPRTTAVEPEEEVSDLTPEQAGQLLEQAA